MASRNPLPLMRFAAAGTSGRASTFAPYAALAGLGAASLLLAGCGPQGEESSTPAVRPGAGPVVPLTVSKDPWILSTESWDASHAGAYLGNGNLGQRVTQAGGLYVGKAEPAFLAGNYERETLVALPSPTPLQISSGEHRFGEKPAEVSGYHQELRLKDGVLVTRANWDFGSGPVELTIETLFARHLPDLALIQVQMKNGSSQPVNAGVPDKALPPSGAEGGALPSGTFIVPLPGCRYQVALAALGSSTDLAPSNPALMPIDGFRTRIAVPAGQTAQVVLATHVMRGNGSMGASHSPLKSGISEGSLSAVFAAHTTAWNRLWSGDIEIDGDEEAQEALRACRYQLLCGSRPDNAYGVPPMGQSTAAFSGHVFWDMESWMLPAVLPQNPELARSMLEYRFRTLEGAQQNAKAERLPGASFAWESASTGKEALQSGDFIHGRHISGDVALALQQYYAATGDKAWLKSRAWPILRETARNWAQRARKEGSAYSYRQVTTPDELAGRVNDSAWTNYVARENLRFAAAAATLVGEKPDPRWKQVADGIQFRRHPESKLILAYEGWKDQSKAKQADTLLLLHPGGMELPPEEAGKLYDYYAPRVIDNGPAMTDAIHAVVAARLGRGEEALKRFQASFRPFMRPPYHAYSEKRSRDNLNFLTGCGGVVQAALYGFAGLHLEPDPKQPDRPLLDPHLPPGWKSMRLKALTWKGKRWDVEITPGQPPKWTPSP